MLDDDGYPSDEALARIARWPQEDLGGLMDFVRAIWWAADWGWHEETNAEGQRLCKISTGGWSGNEDLIRALVDNAGFWARCWRQSRRGGHYIFELPAKES